MDFLLEIAYIFKHLEHTIYIEAIIAIHKVVKWLLRYSI